MTAAHDLAAPSRLASAIKSQWWHGEQPDATAALERHPNLQGDKAVILDLVYEEFCLRRQAGEQVEVEEYCARFPGLRSSLERVLLADVLLAFNPNIVDKFKATELPWPAAGTVFGRFTLLRELGRGTFARVYLATESTTGDRPVAVKLSREGGGEALTLGPLHHDHIVPVLWADRDQSTGFHVVCMPYLGSATLTDVLDHVYSRRGTPPPADGAVISEALLRSARPGDPLPLRSCRGPDLSRGSFVSGVFQLGEHLLDALAFLHGRQLVHCDLKPSNILLTPGGVPLLLDFNLSLAPDVSTGAVIGGTPLYMPPEQLRACKQDIRLSAEAGAKADLFAWASILYELLTGQPPVEFLPSDLKPLELLPSKLKAAALIDLVLERQKKDICPIQKLNPDVPPPLALLLHRCLARDPNDRPGSAAEIADELKRFRQRPNWRLKVALALVVPLLAVLGTWTVKAFGRNAPEPAGGATLAWVEPLSPTAQDYRQKGRKQVEQAWELLQKGNRAKANPLLIQADKNFRDAIDATPRKPGSLHGEWQDHAGRGRAMMLLDDFPAAVDHFTDADQRYRAGKPALGKDPMRARLLACLSYCWARKRNHDLAVANGKVAKAAADPPSAALHNNLGYSYLQQNNLVKARECFDEALQRDANFLPALRNRIALAQKPHQGAAGPGSLLADVDRAIALSRTRPWCESIKLYLRGARLYARAAEPIRGKPRRDATVTAHEERIRQYVRRACVLGADKEQLLKDPEIGSIVTGLANDEQLPKPEQQEKSEVHLSLVDPLDTPLP